MLRLPAFTVLFIGLAGAACAQGITGTIPGSPSNSGAQAPYVQSSSPSKPSVQSSPKFSPPSPAPPPSYPLTSPETPGYTPPGETQAAPATNGTAGSSSTTP